MSYGVAEHIDKVAAGLRGFMPLTTVLQTFGGRGRAACWPGAAGLAAATACRWLLNQTTFSADTIAVVWPLALHRAASRVRLGPPSPIG